MKEKNEYPEIVVNVPMKFKYYLDPLAILVGAILVSGVIIYVGVLAK